MDIQLSAILFQILNFGIVTAALYALLFKPIVNVLEQRSKKIENGLKAAERNLKAETELDERTKSTMLETQRQSSQLKDEVKKAAQLEAVKIVADAKQEAKKVLEKERKAMTAAFEQEKSSLEERYSQLVADAASQLLATALTEKEHKAIIAAHIKSLPKLKL